MNYRWRKNLGWCGEHLWRDVQHDGTQAHGQGQPLLLQVQGGGGQVEGVRDIQVRVGSRFSNRISKNMNLETSDKVWRTESYNKYWS